MSRNRKVLVVLSIAGLAASLAVCQAVLDQYYMGLVALVGINALTVLSLNVTNGYVGIFSLATGGLMSLAAYVSAILTLSPTYKMANIPALPTWLSGLEVPFFLATVAGALVAVSLGALFVFPALRLKGHYFALASLAFAEIIRLLSLNLKAYTRGALSLTGLTQHTNVWWVYGWLLLEIYVVWRLLASKYGRAFVAIREDDTLAEACGINLAVYKTISFLIGGLFAGVGGVLWAHLARIVSPISFRLPVVFNFVIMMVVGGSGSVSGAVLGAILLTIGPEILRPIEEGFRVFGLRLPPLYGLTQILLAIFLVTLLVKRPKGFTQGREILPR